MKRYKPFFKEVIFQGNAGEQLLFTLDLSKVDNLKKFVDDLYTAYKDFKIDKKHTDLTNKQKAKIIFPNDVEMIKSFKSILIMNGFTESEIKNIFNRAQRY